MLLTMRRWACVAFGLLSLLYGTPYAVAITPDAESMTIREWEALWTEVLTRHVDDAGRIDFSKLAQDHVDLDRVVGFVSAVDPVSQPQRFADRPSRLAFYINAYNALAMHGVVQAGVPESLGGLTKVAFFTFGRSALAGKRHLSTSSRMMSFARSASRGFISLSIAWW